MIPALGAEQVLQTLAGFKEYATTGTLLVLDLVGTFVFALSGATAGVKHRLDLFGALVVSFVTATAGGITRDVLIGAVPPAALRDWRYVGISMLAGAIVVVMGHALNAPAAPSAVAGAACCFGLRLVALWRGWRLPTADEHEKATGVADNADGRRD